MWDEEPFKVGERRIYQPVLCSEFDGRIHVRPKPTHGSAIFASTIATLALPLDSGVNRKILHDPRRLLMPGIRTLDRLLALEDQRELRQKIGLWHSAFLSLALNLLAGLQSTNCWHKRSTH